MSDDSGLSLSSNFSSKLVKLVRDDDWPRPRESNFSPSSLRPSAPTVKTNKKILNGVLPLVLSWPAFEISTKLSIPKLGTGEPQDFFASIASDNV